VPGPAVVVGLGAAVDLPSSGRRQPEHVAWRCVVLVIAVAALACPVCLAAGKETEQPGLFAPARTGKERLTDKASDEQRVNDCKVPLAKRTRPRASDCQAR
jgi:hypothetical protein